MGLKCNQIINVRIDLTFMLLFFPGCSLRIRSLMCSCCVQLHTLQVCGTVDLCSRT